MYLISTSSSCEQQGMQGVSQCSNEQLQQHRLSHLSPGAGVKGPCGLYSRPVPKSRSALISPQSSVAQLSFKITYIAVAGTRLMKNGREREGSMFQMCMWVDPCRLSIHSQRQLPALWVVNVVYAYDLSV